MRNTPFLRELHSRAAILSNLPLSDRPARALNPVLKRTIRSSSLGPKSPIRGGTYARRIKVLKAIGTLGMGYGAYNTLGVWLKEEWDLRVADRAKQKERTRAGYSERAPGTIATLFDSAAAFSADLDIKISTISLSFADTLETVGDFPRAYSVYKSTFAELTDNLPSSSETNDSHEVEKRILAIVTALKMAELGELILHLRALGKAPTDPDSGPADEAEVREKFDWALTEALRLRTAAVKPPEKGEEKEIETISPLRWAQEVDLATIMGRVADYYSRKGMVEHAVSLYFYATSTLFPPLNPPTCGPFSPTTSTSFEDRCQALIASAPEAHRSQATTWLKKAAKLIKQAIWVSKATNEGSRELQNIPGAMLFNLGILSEMSNEQGKARAYYEHALKAFKATETYEKAMEVQDALSRLQSQPLSSVKGEAGLTDVESLYPCLFHSVLAR